MYILLYDFTNSGSVHERCDQGELRLVDDEGGQPDRGRLEICYDNEWSPFNVLDYNGAAIACKQLGYLDIPSKSIPFNCMIIYNIDHIII